jgi:integrase/recombinase XerC
MDDLTWTGAVEAWTAYMRASGQTPATVQMRTYQVGRAGRELGGTPASTTSAELLEWLGAQDWKPNTRRAYRGALRAFYSWAVACGLVDRSPAAVLPAVKVPRSLPHPTPEPGYRWALRVADRPVRLAIVLAGAYGLRRSEVAQARREDVVEDVTGGWSLLVVGKGGHERAVPLLDEVARLILARPAGWLFASPRRPGRHLTPAHLAKLVAAELPEGYTMHSLRHRYATVALEATGDLRAVQELLGHARLETTAIYTEVSSQRRRAAVEAAA